MTLVRTPAPSPVEYGEVFTRRWVVEVMLDLAGYTSDRDLAELRLVEPACGAGAFLLPAVERLLASIAATGRSVDEGLKTAIAAFDLQPQHVAHCREAIFALLQDRGVSREVSVVLARHWVRASDYLLSAQAGADLINPGVQPDVDVVIGNPPYIRIEEMDDEVSAQYRSRWPTMSGRADIYVGFYERALRSLKPGGRLAFICADRWMRNQYGASLRQLVARDYSVDVVWTMHDVDAFESAVSAYPAVTVLSRREQGRAVVAEATSQFTAASARELATWTAGSETAAEGVGYRAFRLPHWFSGDEMWPSGSPARVALIEHLNDNFGPLHDPHTGTRVGIGVATGADKVYVVKEGDSDAAAVEQDRLLRLAMVSDTRSGTFQWGGRYLVNPWAPDGTLVDLDKYSGLAGYFEKHRDQLVKRHTAKANPSSWHRTIDKVNHSLIHQQKLLIQDMRTSINPVLENQGCYPHHNLYFVVSEKWDLEVLGGLLLSRLAQAFIEAYSVRMRGNTLRFQSQYLKKIRVPNPDDVGDETKEALKIAFRARDVEAATVAALTAYKLTPDDLE
ncbi:Eco57I restriction-modification methylase domain-containing protein [Lentzea flava]|uniref:Eco57I restriction-modification methylase domain-containing protein n=1 Tax=Lentzea flava TaxID=103732 RepID=UPI001E42031C|nr:Eco57I restriction-modification methylase domain-containing protein [Lentzea flava]